MKRIFRKLVVTLLAACPITAVSFAAKEVLAAGNDDLKIEDKNHGTLSPSY